MGGELDDTISECDTVGTCAEEDYSVRVCGLFRLEFGEQFVCETEVDGLGGSGCGTCWGGQWD